MIKSMTGYGRSVCNLPNKNLIIEIKTLNGKQFSVMSYLPNAYTQKEPEINSMAAELMVRGKVFVNMKVEGEAKEPSKINAKIIERYYEQISKIVKAKGHEPKAEQLFQIIMRIPDVYLADEESLSEEEWKQVRKALAEAFEKTDKFRIEEGKMLEKDVKEKIRTIKNLLSQIEPYEQERTEIIDRRLRLKLDEYLQSEESKNRFEQELIYFMDKVDINEEKKRLEKHCDYFMETVNLKESQGNKLYFISQEIGREINTIGAKANHAQIQKIVVQMKEALGQIKEQSLNIL